MQSSGPPYLPMFESVFVVLANGEKVKVTELDRQVAQKIEETEKVLQHNDRVEWALQFFKKALIEQLLWKVKNERRYFKIRFKSFPAKGQPELQHQLQELADVDITPFQEYDPDSPEAALESPYSGFFTIDEINKHLGYFLKFAEAYSETDPDNDIARYVFKRQDKFGEIVSIFRRSEIKLKRKNR